MWLGVSARPQKKARSLGMAVARQSSRAPEELQHEVEDFEDMDQQEYDTARSDNNNITTEAFVRSIQPSADHVHNMVRPIAKMSCSFCDNFVGYQYCMTFECRGAGRVR
jgi:hypothetical protein